MLPKIKFVNSSPYNRLFIKEKYYDTDVSKEIESFIDKLQHKWKSVGKKILKEIDRVGFKWKIDKIDCFIVKNLPLSGISLPLTIKVSKDIDFAIYILTHELVHVNFYGEKRCYNIKNLLRKKFKEKPLIINHILVCAVTRRVITDIFGDKFFRKMNAIESKFKYKKALKIVEKIYPKIREGNIIESFENYLH